jgi:hypothetical protein
VPSGQAENCARFLLANGDQEAMPSGLFDAELMDKYTFLPKYI